MIEQLGEFAASPFVVAAAVLITVGYFWRYGPRTAEEWRQFFDLRRQK